MKNNRYSNLKIFNFPAKMESFRAGIVTAPLYVRIKPANYCDHGCHFCSYKSDRRRTPSGGPEPLVSRMHETMQEKDNIPFQKLLEVMADLQSLGTKAVTFSGGGEPLMYPNICAIFEEARFRGIDLSIITNGQRLCGAVAEELACAQWVRVSMDYTTAGQMALSRRVPEAMFGKVLDNLADFAMRKRDDCDLGVNYIVTHESCEGLFEFARTLKAIGVENVRFSPVYVPNFIAYHTPIEQRVTAQLAVIQTLLCDETFSVNTTYDIHSASKVPSRPFNRCLYAQTVPVIGADQKVYACHNSAYTEHGCLGSIEHQSFKDMWFSEETKRRLNELNPSAVCNHECANHSKVELFNEIADAHVDNFV